MRKVTISPSQEYVDGGLVDSGIVPPENVEPVLKEIEVFPFFFQNQGKKKKEKKVRQTTQDMGAVGG